MRNLRIDVRVSEEEKIELVRLAAEQEMSLSDYLRSVLLGKEIIVRRENHAPASLMLELSRIGNNLNQLARHANRGDSITSADLARIWHSLEMLWAAFQ
ncbi:plasmid mobilization protein [Pseudomonas knackmussii]|uniref:plasmid mobilization protein n=1 Tax=Pseudomonas knackmussii TaxID=65741 RepID=UPI001363A43C|nr:plasmid mobilization relaxosome protein MobC [Pseudomonas knackmussii]